MSTPQPDPAVAIAAAHEQIAARDFHAAADSCRQAIALEPSAAAWNLLTLALSFLDEVDGAIVAAREAVICDRSNADYWHNLAIAFDRAHCPDDAWVAIQGALNVRPGDHRSTGVLCRLMLRRGEATNALELARQMQESDPNDADAFQLEGMALHLLGRPEESLAAYRREVTLHRAAVLKAVGTEPNLYSITSSIGSMVLPDDFAKLPKK